jgi:hypothetical protein
MQAAMMEPIMSVARVPRSRISHLPSAPVLGPSAAPHPNAELTSAETTKMIWTVFGDLVSENYLRVLAHHGRGPRRRKLSNGRIAFVWSDVEAWMKVRLGQDATQSSGTA